MEWRDIELGATYGCSENDDDDADKKICKF